MPRRPAIGQLAPRFELPVYSANEGAFIWSLDDELGPGPATPWVSDTSRDAPVAGRAVVMIFHRHIH